jgi:thymidylate kinase
MYIALEGPKGSGKSTAWRTLIYALRARGIAVEFLCPTRPIDPPCLIERLSRCWPLRGCDLFRERLYAARSNFHARRSGGAQGLVLGDRSKLTSYVTRWDGRTHDTRRASIRRVDRLESLISLPDHVLYLDAPLGVLVERVRRRGRDYGQVDETPSRLAAQRAAYAELERRGPELGLANVRWHHIDAACPPDAVSAACAEVLLQLTNEDRAR